jgi:hypothetical protein
VLAISKHCLIATIPPCSICYQLWFYGFAMPGIGAEQSSRTHTTPIPPKQKAQGDVCCFGGVGVLFVFYSLNSHHFPRSFVYRITNTKKVQTRSLIRARLEGLLKE